MLTDHPIWNGSTTNHSARIGESITLLCEVCSNPPASFQWLINGSTLLEDVMENGSNIMISKLQERHFGTYVCNASNTVNGTQESRIFDIVLFEDTSYVPGDSYVFLFFLYLLFILGNTI